MHLIGSYKAA